MKKLITILVVAVMVVSLVACSTQTVEESSAAVESPGSGRRIVCCG